MKTHGGGNGDNKGTGFGWALRASAMVVPFPMPPFGVGVPLVRRPMSSLVRKAHRLRVRLCCRGQTRRGG